ncbi:carbohydrate-binding protein, partial [Streptomyces sulfonofaciens]|uniref:carbohydrate-binding protein n=1 Tax=Streptomyces sulfonofaciens TaxID=68272 RepID=UPI003570C25E
MLRRSLGVLATLAAAAGFMLASPASPASAAVSVTCNTPWSASAVYTAGQGASYGGHNWLAKWWTQGETPGTTGEWGVWADQGTCDGGSGPSDPGDPGSPSGFVVSESQFNQMFPNRSSFYTYS